MQSHSSSVIRYLVRVTEFTDLPGNQVSLVVLHLHGTDVLLTQGKGRKKKNPLSTRQGLTQISSNWQRHNSTLADLLFLLFPLLVARLAVRVL